VQGCFRAQFSFSVRFIFREIAALFPVRLVFRENIFLWDQFVVRYVFPWDCMADQCKDAFNTQLDCFVR